jgi:hypothetical protein
MQSVTTTTAKNPLRKRIVAALFVLAFLGINLVAVSHKVHRAVHHDASAPNHECVFVQISHGQCLADAVPMSAPVPVVTEIGSAPVATPLVLPSRDYVLLPGRAPPVSLA